MAAWKEIGCAVDFSAHSWAAVERAVDLARRLEAQLLLVHVIPPSQAGPVPGPGRTLGMAEQRIAAKLDEWRATAERALGREVQARLFTGSPAPELLRFAAGGVDLLVVGTRGPTGLGRLLIGSVAERVARDAQCPVMIVHEHEEEALREHRPS